MLTLSDYREVLLVVSCVRRGAWGVQGDWAAISCMQEQGEEEQDEEEQGEEEQKVLSQAVTMTFAMAAGWLVVKSLEAGWRWLVIDGAGDGGPDQ